MAGAPLVEPAAKRSLPFPGSSYGVFLFIATAVLFIRRSDAFLNPQFWAEDGKVFFLQQYERGAAVILEPYAGYLHLIPRAIAWIADQFFSYALVPSVYNFSSYLVILFVVSNLFSPRVQLPHKPLLALSVLLVPHFRGEVFMNVTNLQWIVFLLLVITLLKDAPDKKYGSATFQAWYDFGCTVISGLTGPFIIFVFPLFLFNLYRRRTGHNLSLALIAGLISACQLKLILAMPVQNDHVLIQARIYSQIIGNKFFGGLFLGTELSQHINGHILCAVGAGLLLATLKVNSDKPRPALYFVWILVAFIVTAIYRFKSDPGALVPPGNGVRYFFIPSVMMIWLLIISLDQKGKWRKRLLVSFLLLAGFSSLSSGFRTKYEDYSWKSYSGNIGKEEIAIPINPVGWSITVKPHQ